MKKLFLLFTVILFSTFLFAKNNWIQITNSQNKTSFKLLSTTQTETIIKLSINAYKLNKVTTPNGDEYTVEIDKGSSILSKSNPDVPSISQSIIIPDNATMQIDVENSNFIEINNISIAPSKGNLLRTVDPSTINYEYGNSYNQNAFYPNKLSKLNNPYIFRNFRGQVVKFFPIQYNPVTKTLRIYTEIIVKITPKNYNSTINTFTRTKNQNISITQEFNQIYKQHFINYSTFNTRYSPLSENGNLLIICASNYMSEMQDFVNWKREKGINTEIVDISTIGNTTTAIQNYISNYYTNNGLSDVLLVGDAAQITTNDVSGGGADNVYGYLSGNDHYPEVIIGRFSAESTTNVETQVKRIIYYEKTLANGASWLNHFSLVGSQAGPGDDNEYDYEHLRNMGTDLTGFTYTSNSEMFDGSQGGLDASGDPTPSIVANDINAGTGLMLYTGHGSDTQWVSSEFSVSDVNNLTNKNELPFIYTVSCVVGNFVGQTCFCEAWMRATDGVDPTGAISIFGSTINQSWDPPMIAQDEMIDILTESYTNNIKRTFGGIGINGCLQMNDETSDWDMIDTWTIFGDPTLMIRTMDPTNMTVSHNSTLPIGVNTFTVDCNVEDALISLTKETNGNVEILGTGVINGGSVNISFTAFTQLDTMLVTVTAFNKVTYQAEVPVINNSGPYISLSNNVINDPTGNNNNLADFDETIDLTTTLSNQGSVTATNVSTTLSTSDSYITITNSTANYGDITNGSTATVNNAYTFNITNNIPDQHLVAFSLDISDGNNNNWTSNFNILVNAPDLNAGTIMIDDAGGNNNGNLDPSETCNIVIPTSNNGHADATNTNGVLSTNSSNITINNATHNFNTLAIGTSSNGTFNITVSPSATLGTAVDFTYIVNSGAYADTTTFTLIIGKVIEDWETNTFTNLNWTNTSNSPWTLVSGGEQYEGNYAAKSGNISDNQTSELYISLNVLSNDSISFFKKVSSEQGENYNGTYYWYDFLEFFIDASSKDKWDGIDANYTRAAYPITAGNHTVKWVYSKDQNTSNGNDCAWIDFISLPPVDISTIIKYNSKDITNIDIKTYPNPVKDFGNISYKLPTNSSVTINLYDIYGKKITNILTNTNAKKGSYELLFNTQNISNGVYFCRFLINNKIFTKKIIINK